MNKPKNKLSHGIKITITVIGAILGLLLILLLVTFIPLFLSDGANRFTGIEQDAAKRAVYFQRNYESVEPLPEFLRHIYVEDVRLIKEDERATHCPVLEYITNYPSDSRAYVVTLKVQMWLEFKPKTIMMYGCDYTRFEG